MREQERIDELEGLQHVVLVLSERINELAEKEKGQMQTSFFADIPLALTGARAEMDRLYREIGVKVVALLEDGYVLQVHKGDGDA